MSLPWPSFWNDVPERDRAALRECVAELLINGVLLGHDGRAREIYLVVRDQYQQHLTEYLAVLNLELHADPEQPILQARPLAGECELVVRFSKDETLLVLTLWRVFDEAQLEQRQEAVVVTAEDVHARLKLYFEHIEPPSPSHLDRMLAKLRRKRLIRYRKSEDDERFGDSQIEILPTLPRIIPFDTPAEWEQQAALYRTNGEEAKP